MDRFRALRFAVLALLLFPAMGVCFAHADSETVWQIGTFDGASIEFGKQLDYANPADDPTYVIGQSIAAKDWPAYQPGSGNGQAGYRPHPFSIEFALPQPPRGLYALKIAITRRYAANSPICKLKSTATSPGNIRNSKLDYRAGDPIGNSPTLYE